MSILEWIQQNTEMVVTVLGFIGIYLNSVRDKQKAQLARDDFERSQKDKRDDHERKLEEKRDIENAKQNAWFQKQIEFQDKKIDSLETRNNDLQQRIGNLTTENGLLKGFIESHKREIEGLHSDITALKEKVRLYQTENGQLISENGRLQDMLYEADERNKAAQIVNMSHLEKIAELKAEIERLDMIMRDHEGVIAAQSKLIRLHGLDNSTNTPIPHLDDSGNIVKQLDSNTQLVSNGNDADDSNTQDNNKKEIA